PGPPHRKTGPTARFPPDRPAPGAAVRRCRCRAGRWRTGLPPPEAAGAAALSTAAPGIARPVSTPFRALAGPSGSQGPGRLFLHRRVVDTVPLFRQRFERAVGMHGFDDLRDLGGELR